MFWLSGACLYDVVFHTYFGVGNEMRKIQPRNSFRSSAGRRSFVFLIVSTGVFWQVIARFARIGWAAMYRHVALERRRKTVVLSVY